MTSKIVDLQCVILTDAFHRNHLEILIIISPFWYPISPSGQLHSGNFPGRSNKCVLALISGLMLYYQQFHVTLVCSLLLIIAAVVWVAVTVICSLLWSLCLFFLCRSSRFLLLLLLHIFSFSFFALYCKKIKTCHYLRDFKTHTHTRHLYLFGSFVATLTAGARSRRLFPGQSQRKYPAVKEQSRFRKSGTEWRESNQWRSK